MHIGKEVRETIGLVTVVILMVLVTLALWIVVWGLSLIFGYGLFGL